MAPHETLMAEVITSGEKLAALNGKDTISPRVPRVGDYSILTIYFVPSPCNDMQ